MVGLQAVLEQPGALLRLEYLSLVSAYPPEEGLPANVERVLIEAPHSSNGAQLAIVIIIQLIHFNMKAILVVALLATALTLKPSQAGVNDWHLNNLGEIRTISFTRSKLQYVSALGQIGVVDRLTGNVEQRLVVAETEKVVGWGRDQLAVATRHNQILTYSFKPSGVESVANNYALGDHNKIESYARIGKREYFLTAKTITEDKTIIREAKPEEEFLRLAAGASSHSADVVFVAYASGSQLCIENYQGFNFLKLYCLEGQKNIDQFIFEDGSLFLSLNGNTYIFSEHLELIHEAGEPLLEVVRGAAVFRTYSFDCVHRERLLRRAIWSSREEVAMSAAESGSHLTIFRDGIELFQVAHDAAKSQLLRAWFHHRSDLEYELVVQFTDLELVLFSVSKGEVEVGWRREESLAYIKQVVFMKYNKIDTLDNPYHRHLISHAYRAKSFTEKLMMVPKDVILRFSEEVTDIFNHILRAAEYLLELGSIDRNSLRKFQMSKEQEIKYGLRKYLIAATSLNTIIALDSKSKQMLWKINHNKNQFVSLVQLKRDYETENAILVTYSSIYKQVIIEEILENGEVVQLATLPSPTAPAIYKLNEHSILLKSGDRVQRFHLLEDDDTAEKQYYFYTVGEQDVEGWRVVDDEVTPIWNFQLKGRERVLKTACAFRGHQISHIPLFDREKVFFKNVDFTNIAVLTALNQTTIGLYIINGRTGKAQYSAFKSYVNNGLPVNLVYDQNNVLVSYYHTRNKYFEIWTIEQYQERIENSAVTMISDYLNGLPYTPQENREQTIFESEVYASPVAIKALYVSQSKQSLTRRNLFIITRENKLFTINRDFVNTRRPRKDAKDAKGFFSNEKLPEYAPLLPFNPTFYLSYDLPLSNLQSVVFSPADMESSIFVFCYGMDNFLIRTAPDKTFDMIMDDFNYLVLLLILVVGTVLILVFRRQLKLAKLKKPHLE